MKRKVIRRDDGSTVHLREYHLPEPIRARRVLYRLVRAGWAMSNTSGQGGDGRNPTRVWLAYPLTKYGGGGCGSEITLSLHHDFYRGGPGWGSTCEAKFRPGALDVHVSRYVDLYRPKYGGWERLAEFVDWCRATYEQSRSYGQALPCLQVAPGAGLERVEGFEWCDVMGGVCDIPTDPNCDSEMCRGEHRTLYMKRHDE